MFELNTKEYMAWRKKNSLAMTRYYFQILEGCKVIGVFLSSVLNETAI